MNKKIKELEEQATETIQYGLNGRQKGYHFNRQKFAELIIREAIDAIQAAGQKYEVKSAGEWQANLFSAAVKKHFGVE